MITRPLSHVRPSAMKQFLYGVPYYPEHWEETIRAGDPAWMREAGFNCVRMGEFAWDLFEPQEGCFDFSLHTGMIARLAEQGIMTIFCTPTAAPPVWLSQKHPEILRVNADGMPMQHGSRQHPSYMSPVFREYSKKITMALARHFAGNPHVIGWQTDNEFHCHFSEDHSPAAQEAFRNFLRRRFHDDIGALNRAWGNAFWALTYASFDEITTPRGNRPTWTNPAQVLDYNRFLSDSVTAFQRDQVEILRSANPAWFVTHNGCFAQIDYRGAFTQDLDVLGYDCYPFFDYDPATRPQSHASGLDLARSYGGNFLLLEQQSGPGGQGDFFHDTPEPGEMRRMEWTSIAHGADSLFLFRERSCRFGAEEYWCGVLDHDNIPRRRFQEAKKLGKEIAAIGPELIGTHVAIDVGIAAADFDSQHAHGVLSLGLPDPKTAGNGIHKLFWESGHAVGYVHPEDDLSRLALYFIPHFAIFQESWLPNLTAFVERGGILLIGARTATKDSNNNVIPETPPGLLAALAGATVQEYGRQNAPQKRPLNIRTGTQTVPSTLWYEQLLPAENTEVIGEWSSRHLKGSAAITLKNHNKGAVIYVGTYFDEALICSLKPLLKKRGAWPAKLPGFRKGVEIVQRTDGTRSVWFYINHSEKKIALEGTAKGRNLITGKRISGSLNLAPNDVAIIGNP
jgi:beta-galactosidase